MKPWIKRALRTFLQAAVGYITVAVPTIEWSDTSAAKAALIGLGVSAVSAGLAAVMNIKEEEKP